MRYWVSGTVAVIALIFLLSPFIVVFGASIDTGSAFHIRFPPHGITFDKYKDIPTGYIAALQTSLVLGVTVTAISTAVGLMAALAIVRGHWSAPEFLQSFFRLPVQIPLVVTGAVYLQFYYQVAALTGLNPTGSLLGLVLAHLFIAIPYSVGTISAVLAKMDRSLEEAAESLGATKWTTFWKITLPAMKPGIVAGAFYAFILSFGDVPVSIFLVTSQTMTLPVLIFQDMIFDIRPGILAISTIVTAASLILIILVQKLAGLNMVLPSGQRA